MLRHSLFGIVKVCFESIQFHLMKQIEILLDDYGAVIKSDSDIKKIEEMVRNQGISPMLELEWYVSNNPLCLIKRMIETSDRK